MSSAVTFILVAVGLLVGVVLAVVLIMYLIIPLCRAIGWIFARIFGFIGGEIADLARTIGALITTLVLIPLVLGTIVIGRWSASAHFGRAIQREFGTLGACLYRIFLGHPARLFGLAPLTEGLERRIPEVVRATPGADKPAGRAGQFDGYKIVGSLMGGGSGAKLYIAEPDAIKRATFERQGFGEVGRVVIKTFSIRDGSTLPQIVRESRALDAARRLGFVLDHDLTPERFFYITRYVPGESLGLVTQQLHASGAGLAGRELARAMKYTADLLHTLDAYHQGGLWHKDVKPDNIIIHDDTAHLVDLGLVTPLRSAMTLTTHGTEYFRDPEMVRMALKGVKVHQVDGARFDIYAVGAVMYSVIENSFPAHGGLSQISRRCPDALRWIVRRAMTDYDKRYLRASDMLADLEVVRSAPDPFAVRLADLPSVRGGAAEPAPAPDHFAQHGAPFTPLTAPAVAQAASAHAARSPHNAQPEPASTDPAANAPSNPAGEAASQGGTTRHRPRIVITDWFKGQYAVTGGDDVPVAAARQSNTGFGPGGFRPGASGPRAAAAVAMATAADAMNRAAQHFGAANPHANRRANPHAQPQPVPEAGAADFGPPAPGQARRTPRVRAIPDPSRRSAADQVRSARERAAAARHRAQTRMAGRYAPFRNTDANAGAGKGASAAIFGFIGVCVLFAGGIVTAALMRGTGDANLASAPDGARVVVSDPSFPTPPSVPDLTNGFAVPAIADGSSHSVQTRIDSAIRQATDRIVEIQEVFREAGELASVAAQSPGGTVIVVTDVLPPMTRDARASIDGAMARLMAFGFTLVGSVQGVDVEGEDLDRQIELIAQVRSARGQVPLGTPDADRILQGYLAAHPDAGDAIVWITPGEDRDEPTFYLVLPANPDGESTRAMRLRNTLQTALSAPPGQKS